MIDESCGSSTLLLGPAMSLFPLVENDTKVIHLFSWSWSDPFSPKCTQPLITPLGKRDATVDVRSLFPLSLFLRELQGGDFVMSTGVWRLKSWLV